MTTRQAFVGEIFAVLNYGPGGVKMTYGGEVLTAARRAAADGEPDEKVAIVTVIGDDPVSDGALAHLRQCGLDTGNVYRAPGRRLSLRAGEHDWRDRAAIRVLFAEEGDPALAALAQYERLHFSVSDLSALPPQSAKRLLSRLTSLRDRGHGIVLIDDGSGTPGIDRFYRIATDRMPPPAPEARELRRMGTAIGVRPEKIAEYRRLHADVWPDVLARLRASNVTNYSIYLREPENLMFGYGEYVGTDYEADMAAIAADPVTRDWWALCGPMQVPFDSRADGEWWAAMDEVFHMD